MALIKEHRYVEEIDGKDHSTEEGKHNIQRRNAYLHRLGFTVKAPLPQPLSPKRGEGEPDFKGQIFETTPDEKDNQDG